MSVPYRMSLNICNKFPVAFKSEKKLERNDVSMSQGLWTFLSTKRSHLAF